MGRRDTGSWRLRHDTAVAGAAVLTPAAYLGYVATLRLLQGEPVERHVAGVADTVLYFFVLALIGVIATSAWFRGFRMTPVGAAAGLLVWPWLYVQTTIGDPVSPLVACVGVLLVASIEGIAITDRSTLRERFDGPVVRRALAVGCCHFLVGFGLQTVTEMNILVGPGPAGMIVVVLLNTVLGLGLVFTGAVPVVLWYRERMVVPALTTAGWLLWGIDSTWRHWSRYPSESVGAFRWFEFPMRPYPDYMMGVAELVVLLIAVTGLAVFLRRLAQFLDLPTRGGETRTR